jgi:hypothetical protein
MGRTILRTDPSGGWASWIRYRRLPASAYLPDFSGVWPGVERRRGPQKGTGTQRRKTCSVGRTPPERRSQSPFAEARGGSTRRASAGRRSRAIQRCARPPRAHWQGQWRALRVPGEAARGPGQKERWKPCGGQREGGKLSVAGVWPRRVGRIGERDSRSVGRLRVGHSSVSRASTQALSWR